MGGDPLQITTATRGGEPEKRSGSEVTPAPPIQEQSLPPEFIRTIEDLNLTRLIKDPNCPEGVTVADLTKPVGSVQLTHLVQSLGSTEASVFCHPSNRERLTFGLADIALSEDLTDQLRIAALRQMSLIAQKSHIGTEIGSKQKEVIVAGDQHRLSYVLPAHYLDAACEGIASLIGKNTSPTTLGTQIVKNGVEIIEAAIDRAFTNPVYLANYNPRLPHLERFFPEHRVSGETEVRYPTQLSPESVVKGLSRLISQALQTGYSAFDFALTTKLAEEIPGFKAETLRNQGLEKILEGAPLVKQEEVCSIVAEQLVNILSDNNRRGASTS